MSLRSAVAEALADLEGWRVEMALALAAEVEEKGSASAAKELRGLMSELVKNPAPRKETGLSEFERKLAERQSKSKAARRSTG